MIPCAFEAWLFALCVVEYGPVKDPFEREVAVFGTARRLPEAKRAAYLDEACAGDAALRERVEELLKAGEEAEGFLQEPAPGAQRPENSSAAPASQQDMAAPGERAGGRIGRYKLLQQIGEGGCGVVYMAEQEEPVRRRVALKVIKLGMDTKQVIARFEAERQALAMMDHANIAKVLDAGTTETGRPYFVMELVRGTKITGYCDEHTLSTIERLELFMQVCNAVQHAHQKGIIHRDLKPSNILVASNDGVPVPKVIDFGIAKATQGRLTDQTLFTAFEQFIGTPAYMSPEQTELTMQDVDTRTDIYSLGVLLYELLTSRTPFDAKELLASGLDAMRRTIREREPKRPSTRLSTMLQGELTTTARQRDTDAPKLVHLVRGDLDWIVMKCLEKDRTRRYDTATGLANDVRRHLNCEPVVARPPSRLYEFQKTIRRHKVGFAVTAALIAALAAGVVVSSWGAMLARQAEQEQARLRRRAVINEQKQEAEAAKSRQVAQFLQDILQSIIPSVAVGQDSSVLRRVLDETARRLGNDFRDQPELEAQLRTTVGQVYEQLGAYNDAETMFRRALALRRKALGDDDPAVADALDLLARFLSAQNNLPGAEVAVTEALAIRRHRLGNDHPLVAQSLGTLGAVLSGKGDVAGAEASLREALAIWRRRSDTDHAGLATGVNGLMDALLSAGKQAAAEQLLEEVMPKDVATQPQFAPLLRVRAELRARTGHWRQAAADFSKLIELAPDNHENYHFLAPLLVQCGDEEAYRRLCEQIRTRFGGTTNNPTVADRMAKDCLILHFAGADLTTETRLADVAVAFGYPGDPWFQFCKGLAEYRQGSYASAAEWTQKVLAQPVRRPRRDMEAYLVLAMAKHQLHKTNDAHLALARGVEIAEGNAPKLENGHLNDGWVDWLIAHALMREAKALMADQPVAANNVQGPEAQGQGSAEAFRGRSPPRADEQPKPQ